MSDIFICFLNGYISYQCYSIYDDIYSFYQKFPQYEHFSDDIESLSSDIITNIFHKINVNDFYLSKRIYVHVIHLLIEFYNFNISELPKGSIFRIMIEDIFKSIDDIRDLIPLLIPEKIERYYLQTNIAFLNTIYIRASIINFIISLYPEGDYSFIQSIKEYIPNYDNIVSQKIKTYLTNEDKRIYLESSDYQRFLREKDNDYQDQIIAYLKYYIEGDYERDKQKSIKETSLLISKLNEKSFHVKYPSELAPTIRTKFLSIVSGIVDENDESENSDFFDESSIETLVSYLSHYANIMVYGYDDFFQFFLKMETLEDSDKIISKFDNTGVLLPNNLGIKMKYKLLIHCINEPEVLKINK